MCALGTVAGAALAASQTVATSSTSVVHAVIQTDGSGGTVFGVRDWDNEIEFSVDFDDSDCTFSVDGVAAGSYDPLSKQRVEITLAELGGVVYVYDDNTGALLGQRTLSFAESVGEVTASAGTVHSLTTE